MKRKSIRGTGAALILGIALTLGNSLPVNAEDNLTQDTSITGAISRVTSIDVRVPINGINFTIDENGNFSSADVCIYSDSTCPVYVSLYDVKPLSSNAPSLVQNTYTETQWENMTEAETLSKMALQINGAELEYLYSKDSSNTEKQYNLGVMPTGNVKTSYLKLKTTGNYGRNWGSGDNLIVKYKLVILFSTDAPTTGINVTGSEIGITD